MVIAQALILAVVLERFIQFVVKPLFPQDVAYTPYIALGLGVLFAVGFNVDFLHELGFVSTVPYFGAAVSGLFIGGGSHFVNDVISVVRGDSAVSLASADEPAPRAA